MQNKGKKVPNEGKKAPSEAKNEANEAKNGANKAKFWLSKEGNRLYRFRKVHSSGVVPDGLLCLGGQRQDA